MFMLNNPEDKKTPAWIEAVEDFVNAGFKAGDIIPHEWFYGVFGITAPQKCKTVDEAQKSQFAYLTHIEGLKAALLEEHLVALRSARGVGYEVVSPDQQTEWAMNEVRSELRKTFRNGNARLNNIQLEVLSDEQRKENMDARGRLATIRSMTRKELR